MYRKLFAIISIIVITIFSFSVVLAADNSSMLQDAANGVRDAVGGAENAIEDGARDISNTSKDVTGSAENSTTDRTNGSNGTTSSTGTNSSVTSTNPNGDTYSATRTSAETGSTFMGMNATAWTWLIIGIAAIAIIALVWYYGTQLNNTNNDRN